MVRGYWFKKFEMERVDKYMQNKTGILTWALRFSDAIVELLRCEDAIKSFKTGRRRGKTRGSQDKKL
jgi:hypothetical protein